MRVVINCEYRFSRTPDGGIWTETAFAYPYWEKYLKVFSEIVIFARVQNVSEIKEGAQSVIGPGVSLKFQSYYVGPLGYLKNRRHIRRQIASALNPSDAVIIILPSPLALVLEASARRKKLPYGVEVMGDPWEVFGRYGVGHPLRVFFRYYLAWHQWRTIRRASAVCYVTQNSLQKRYPAREDAFSIGVSNIDLKSQQIAAHERTGKLSNENEIFKLVSVGSLAQLYKGADVMLRAMTHLQNRARHFHLTWVGGGIYKDEMIKAAASLGIADCVSFVGQVTAGDAIIARLDAADLFILPSRTEGLPRALIEAMARGLPAIGSRVGGIPELLEMDEMFESGDDRALANMIEAISVDPHRQMMMSQRNLQKSRAFTVNRIDEQKQKFLKAVHRATPLLK